MSWDDGEDIRSELVELLGRQLDTLEMQLEREATAGELRAYDERQCRIGELQDQLGNLKRAA